MDPKALQKAKSDVIVEQSSVAGQMAVFNHGDQVVIEHVGGHLVEIRPGGSQIMTAKKAEKLMKLNIPGLSLSPRVLRPDEAEHIGKMSKEQLAEALKLALNGQPIKSLTAEFPAKTKGGKEPEGGPAGDEKT